MNQLTVRWAGLSWYLDTLNWEAYGYWQEEVYARISGWYRERLAVAKQIAPLAKPAEVWWQLTTEEWVAGKAQGALLIYDRANPWIQPLSLSFAGFSQEGLERWRQQRVTTEKRLHMGVLDCLIFYAETGIATMPDWLPKQQLYGYRGGRRVKLYQWLKEARGEHSL